MTVVSLHRRVMLLRKQRHLIEKAVEAQVERTERSVLAATIASNRYERAAVELIRDRERLAEAGL